MLLRVRKPSPAMVVACIALLVALSGASYAAVTLPRNSVGTPQLKKNAVVSVKVRNGSLKALDFAAGQLPKTAGFGSTNASANPSSTPERTIATQTVSLPAQGRLLVIGRFTRSTQCNPTAVQYGLYVDGAPIAGSGVKRAAGLSEPVNTFSLEGVTGPLTAGAHTLEIKLDCLGGDFQGQSFFDDEAITAVLLSP